MNSSDSSSPPPSPSPPASPEASITGPPSLEQLVAHFVAAKRSLTATAYLARANKLVASSRSHIEEVAVLNAKNTYAGHGVDDAVSVLRSIRDGIGETGDGVAGEFKEVLGKLDEASRRLEATLGKLRKTVVHASLQRRNADDVTNDDDVEEDADNPADGPSSEDGVQRDKKQKTLIDFIDESKHKSLLDSLYGLIDSYQDAKADFGRAINAFDNSLSTISNTLQSSSGMNGSNSSGSGKGSGSGPYIKRTLLESSSEGTPPAVPALYRSIESSSIEMSHLLQSLLSHYDLCVTALKHTEGGGEAARQAVTSTDLKNPQAEEESLYRKRFEEVESMDERARMDLLTLVATDAQEVDEVVTELRNHAAGLEKKYAQLCKHVDQSRKTHGRLQATLEHLHAAQNALPGYLAAARTFQLSWATGLAPSLAEQTLALEAANENFVYFIAAYDNLLREVDRRTSAERQLKKVADKAQRELDRLWESDDRERTAFLNDVGIELPRDIWPGAGEKGGRWIVRLEAGDD